MIKTTIFLLMLTLVLSKPADNSDEIDEPNEDDLSEADKRIIMPGTKWCGVGNKADNDDELGAYRDVDACCREHDKCPKNVKAFAKKYGYRNWRPFTITDCECDSTFYNCLKAADEHPRAAKTVGKIFFNILHMPCLKFNADGTKATKGQHLSYK